MGQALTYPRRDWTAQQVIDQARELGAEIDDQDFAQWFATRLNRSNTPEDDHTTYVQIARMQSAFKAGRLAESVRGE
jgi:hypothetical protein